MEIFLLFKNSKFSQRTENFMPNGDNHIQEIHCSFCGKSEHQVNRLIEGPGVYICDECIEFCSSLLDPEPVSKAVNRGRKKKEEEFVYANPSIRLLGSEVVAANQGELKVRIDLGCFKLPS